MKARIAHRDLKPDNLILSTTGKEYMLADFGESCITSKNLDEIQDMCVGTPLYMSPELDYNYRRFQEWGYSSKSWYDPYASDVYSLGIIMVELMGISKQEIKEFKV